MQGYIGVDLDGTLAYHSGGCGPIGKPIKQMVNRVKQWLKEGKKVKVFTARGGDSRQVSWVKQWLKEQGLPDLDITNIKDSNMIEFWDDRAVGVKKNKGVKKAIVHFIDLETRMVKASKIREDVTDAEKKAALKEYGDVQYADEKNKKYPVDKKHIRAAISYFAKPKNYGEYGEEGRRIIARKIMVAAKKHGINIDEENWKETFGLAKAIPSQAQIEAGNYKKKHISVQGLNITIENSKGSTRSGVSEDGKKWKTKLKSDYGYIKGTKGRDKDHIDVFVGKSLQSEVVYIINQISPKTGKFDEHKVMLGYNTEKEAKQAYLANYEQGWQGVGSIKTKTMGEFKQWLKGNTTRIAKSVGYYINLTKAGNPHRDSKTGKYASGETKSASSGFAKYDLYFKGDKFVSDTEIAIRIQARSKIDNLQHFSQLLKKVSDSRPVEILIKKAEKGKLDGRDIKQLKSIAGYGFFKKKTLNQEQDHQLKKLIDYFGAV